MITEQQLKDRCTPEFIKRMVELAEGFEFLETDSFYNYSMYSFDNNFSALLIHRAVEGWNKEGDPILIANNKVVYPMRVYPFSKYQQQSLTQAECAMIHCLLDIFEEERK